MVLFKLLNFWVVSFICKWGNLGFFNGLCLKWPKPGANKGLLTLSHVISMVTCISWYITCTGFYIFHYDIIYHNPHTVLLWKFIKNTYSISTFKWMEYFDLKHFVSWDWI